MLAKLTTAAIIGIDAVPIEVEVDIAHGLPSITIVGLPDTSVQEARERIRAALANSGFSFPKTRVTINLAPADIKKEGSGFDFPIALALLVASGVIHARDVEHMLVVGELALDGSLRPIAGGLMYGLCASKMHKSLCVPPATAEQAAFAESVTVFSAHTLQDAVAHVKGVHRITPCGVSKAQVRVFDDSQDDDVQFIQGQESAKRALLIAASGEHSILFSGPPGTGKTMLARALRTLLPSLSLAEQLEVTRIWSAAGALPCDAHIVASRPFRQPHHTASAVSLIGGGHSARPGEVSLAHRGVLFLDECAEFPRSVINVLRQPMETGTITISRAEHRYTYPAQFQLIAATNPCPCGNAGSTTKACTCTSTERQRYAKRLIGPLLDRIDMVVRVERESISLRPAQKGRTSVDMRSHVAACWETQQKRNGGVKNARLSRSQVPVLCHLGPDSEKLLVQAVAQYHLSRRAVDRILRVARTIADMEKSEHVRTEHIAESLQYRVSQDDIFPVC